jgi:bifunctional oligoribonuclease and PAP phosphatase NrnA
VTSQVSAVDVSPADMARRFERERRILVMAHESPDGDAIGSVVAIMLMARRLGVGCRAFIPGHDPLPAEYAFLQLQGEIHRGSFPPADGSTVYVLDCATPERVAPGLRDYPGVIVNIDHHNDNAGWGAYNLIDREASSTTEVLYKMFTAGGFSLDVDVATALYTGLVTDTGRFQYANTTPAGHRMAAALQETGVDVNAVYRAVYSSYPVGKLRLLGRALDRLTLLLDGRLAVSWLDLHDMARAQAEDSYAEGIIDSLRTVEGVLVAALLRERRSEGGVEIKVSLRSTDGAVDVSSIAHVWDGGGHVQAAGFTSREVREAVIRGIERETLSRL